MKLTEAVYDAIFNGTSDGILIVSRVGIEICNKAFTLMTGYQLGESASLKIPDLQPPGSSPSIFDELRKTFEGGEGVQLDVEFARKSGALFFVNASLSAVELDGRRCVLMSLRDITERRMAEIQLRQALREAKVLRGLLPICAGCKKIRDDKNQWTQVEAYVAKHTEATFTHGMCPDCIKKYYPDIEMDASGNVV
ncbi:MAG: PAS domain-containing protein [Candidatus Staskawiczbacteria bacterium]|nr:PAS domain-containing protein [Candidatus Staskawiczbacteria bacterium]